MKGTGNVGEILTDIEFKDNLCQTIKKLDAFIGTSTKIKGEWQLLK